MQIDQAAYEAIQPELLNGESVLWAGCPSLSVIFHKEDFLAIPFSLLWGGFAIFWEGAVSGFWASTGKRHTASQIPFQLWGIPFVLMGQYMIWGRFFFDAWNKHRTFYAVTNRRILVVQNIRRRRFASTYIDTLPTIDKESRSDGIGTLRFNEQPPVFGQRRNGMPWNSMIVNGVPVFRDIDRVDDVHNLIAGLREQAWRNR
jgi:hypothetical protein